MRKAAIVTGSATGIGAACAEELARRGFDVVVNYTRSRDEAERTAQACIEAGARAFAVQADVAQDADCRRLAAQALEAYGRLDALVNSAGTTRLVPHHDLDGLDAADFQRIYAVNCIGPYQMVRACAPALRATGRAAVVNISAIGGITGAGSSIAYAASKGALNTMTLSLARALGPEIRVNAVCPGLVESRWMRELHGERYDRFKAEWEDVAPLAATAEAADVADAVAWFVTGASQVTGQCLVLDSGYTLGRPSGRPPRA
jgi:3-oxoacyl-[acyl-carrier protein] reductase